MKTVYDAANLIDAHLVRHALEDAGIPVFIRGEALTGGMGELPIHGMVQVCVPELVWPQADAVVKSLDLGTPREPLADDDWEPGLQPG
ncbi:MAG TPA: DUF2007 domain-containing protein [Lysobacter sp.]